MQRGEEKGAGPKEVFREEKGSVSEGNGPLKEEVTSQGDAAPQSGICCEEEKGYF